MALSVMLASFAPSSARAQSPSGAPLVTVRDAETESLLRAVAHPLFRVAGVDPAMVRITLIQARPINAFVTTGNRLFINTGLIQQSAAVGDLAGVLAHETGHIAGGHVARLPEEMRNALFRSLAGMLVGGAAAAAGGGGGAAAAAMLGSQAMAMGELYAFTRAQEQAADQAGMTYLDRLGWSGRGLQRLLGRMQEQELLTVGRQDPYFRTHPLSRDRLEFVSDWVKRASLRGGGGDAPFPPGLELGFPDGAGQAGRLHRRAARHMAALPGKRRLRPCPLCRGDRAAPFRTGRGRARHPRMAWRGSSRAIRGCGSCKGRCCSRRGGSRKR